MNECCGGDCHEKNFWWWWEQQDQEMTFTLSEVLEILQEVRSFNAGAIDAYLDNHIDKVMKRILEDKQK